MASEELLTNRQIVRLAAVISTADMETVALGYLDLDEAWLKSLKTEKKEEPEAFNREVLRKWSYKNHGQVKKLARKLYEAAEEGGYINTPKIQEILKIFPEDAKSADDEEDDFGLKLLIHHLKTRQGGSTAEIAPWAQNFTTKTKDVRTRLEILKYNGRAYNWVTNDYEELFEASEPAPKIFGYDSETFCGTKIFVKGKSGKGKTMMAKKIVNDWTNGIFKRFVIIFFISMKSAEPSDSLEDIIMKQNDLGELEFTRESLRDILDQFGEYCLIIVDGFDDHTNCPNKDVLRIIKNKNLNYNILLTSTGLNGAKNLDKYFNTVCELQGFQDNDLYFFAKRLDEKASEMVIKSMLPESKMSEVVRGNPLLIVLQCIIESEDREFKSVRNLTPYQIYVSIFESRTHSLDATARLRFAERIGKLAFEILTAGKVSTKADVPDENHGFLVSSNSSLVTFAHTSFQIFFAALYFLLVLDDGCTVDSLLGIDCQRPVVLVNAMFLYFCISLLGDDKFLLLKKHKQIGDRLQRYILERIDCEQLELSSVAEVYPALRMSHDQDLSTFLLQTLSLCQKVKDLILAPTPDMSVKQILSKFKDKSQNLTSIRLLSDDDEISADVIGTFEPGDLSIIIHNQSGQCVDDLLEFLDTMDRESCLYFFGGNRSKSMIDLSTFTRPNIRKLYIRSSQKNDLTYLTVKQDIPLCRKLTHIYIPKSHFVIGEETVEALSEAVQNGRFPNLKHVTMHDSSLKFGRLFGSGCATLRELNFSHLQGNEDKNCLKQLLPQLVSILIIGSSVSSLFTDPDQPLTNDMKYLKLQEFSTDLSLAKALETNTFCSLSKLDITGSFNRFVDVFCGWKVSNLTELSLSGHNYDAKLLVMLSQSEVVRNLHHLSITGFDVRGQLFCFFSRREGFPYLKTLALTNGEFRSQDLRTLAQAGVDGLLPSLTELDVSGNSYMDTLRCLFEFDCKWDLLTILNVDRKDQWRNNRLFVDFKTLTLQAQSGCLQALEKLNFYTHSHDFLPNLTNATCWRRLNTLEISSCYELTHKQILGSLATAVEQGFLPALKDVVLCGGSSEAARPRASVAHEKQRLRIKGVSVSFITRNDSW